MAFVCDYGRQRCSGAFFLLTIKFRAVNRSDTIWLTVLIKLLISLISVKTKGLVPLGVLCVCESA